MFFYVNERITGIEYFGMGKALKLIDQPPFLIFGSFFLTLVGLIFILAWGNLTSTDLNVCLQFLFWLTFFSSHIKRYLICACISIGVGKITVKMKTAQ